ncbi:MAG TPA: bifunctional oligoribonuclease/PAP phosphatase NrnA [Candidatus Nitrosocosmicus sp.]|nr:bifunctional oligoribonuclease/PAP phosphatase NrnA [Candidatus Nitrosocosmicus sp.]
MDEKINRLLKYLEQPKKSILTLHRSPDGDSIGSNLAFYHILRYFGHEVDVISKDPIPDNLLFLPGSQKITLLNPKKINWTNYDYYWALDMSSPEMLGENVQFPDNVKIITIDHHSTNSKCGHLNIIDEKTISTCSIIFDLCKKSEIIVNNKIATCLLTGILTDSGFFSYITDPAPLKDAQELLQYNVNFQNIMFHLQKKSPFEDLVFIGKALATAKLYKEKKVAFISVDNELWTTYGKSVDKNRYLTPYARDIADTNLGVVLIEEQPKSIRVELRSRNLEYDVSVLAQKLGGGGHKAASGARIEGKTIRGAIQLILKLI